MDEFTGIILIAAGISLISWLFGGKKHREKQPSKTKKFSAEMLEPDSGSLATPEERNAPRDWSQRMPISKVTADSCWQPADACPAVNGLRFTMGRVFVGSGLAAANGHSVEPALVNPDLTVDLTNPDDRAHDLGYWPQYHRIGPQARAGYLKFLASDRANPRVPLGFVFLYFYGIERRLLVDAVNPGIEDAEYQDLIAEIERLLSVYGHSASFRGYATRLLDYLQVSKGMQRLTTPEALERRRDGLPSQVIVVLGTFSSYKQPIPAELAYEWVMHDPQFRLRTAVERCSDEFRALFSHCYRQRHGEGMVVKPNKTRIKLEYQPASPGIQRIQKQFDLPNITVLQRPVRLLQALVETCSEQLNAYSRFIGKNPEKKDTLEALALLPDVLASERKTDEVAVLEEKLRTQVVDQGFSQFPVAELDLGGLNDKPTAKSMRHLASYLERCGIGFEPDVRYTGALPEQDGHCILFPVERGANETPLSDDFEHVAMVMRLAGFVLNGQWESLTERHSEILDDFLDEFPSLSDLEVQHLRAYCFWSLGRKATLAGLRKRVDGMNSAQHAQLEQLLVRLASADGVVDKGELNKLQRTANLLGRDPNGLYSHIHAAMAEPTVVRKGRSKSNGFRIPEPDEGAEPRGSGRQPLDRDALNQKREETAQIAGVLSEIFTSDEASPLAPATQGAGTGAVVAPKGNAEPSKPQGGASSDSFGGLDTPHRTLLEAIANQDAGMPWAEAETVAAELKLMLAGAIDMINETAFDLAGAPVLEEEGDTLAVDNEILEEMKGDSTT